MAFATNFQKSQDTLYALAADTGGKALLDNNDLTVGIVNAQKAISSYYILGYYTTNTKLDGKFRKISIAAERPAPPSSTTARATSPARSSLSSPPPTRNASSKTPSCWATRSPT